MPSLRSFVAHLDHTPLLCDLLARHDLQLTDEEQAGDTAVKLAGINRALEAAPLGTKTALDHDIDRICGLSSETGAVAIDAATLQPHLAELPSRHARALWVFLHDPLGFRRAEELHYTGERRRGRDWEAFHIDSEREPLQDEATLAAFAEAFRQAFDTPNVHIDIFDRFGPDLSSGEVSPDGSPSLTQFTIYREDRSNTENVFRNSKLTTENRRTVVEASVTYERATGLIECVASKRDARSLIVQLVATELLGCSPELEPVKAAIYSLDALQKRVPFPTEAGDHISEVHVAMLRLEPTDTVGEKITVEVAAANDSDIWATVGERLGETALLSDYQITQAKLVVRYLPKGAGRTRSLPVVITPPHRSTLKEHMPVEQTLTAKYLPRWGLVVA